MLGRLGHWTIDLVVLAFAVYAFAFVPLGKRTGLEHVQAILGTREAKEAGGELMEAGGRLTDEVLGELPSPVRGRPILPELAPGEAPQMRVTPLSLDRDAGADASLVD